MIVLKSERKVPENDYGHDEGEWGSNDDYERLEWEERYESRNKRWRAEGEHDG